MRRYEGRVEVVLWVDSQWAMSTGVSSRLWKIVI